MLSHKVWTLQMSGKDKYLCLPLFHHQHTYYLVPSQQVSPQACLPTECPLVFPAEGSSDLASLGRTLDKELHKIIFDEQVETLALPFIGSGKASAVAATAPFIINQASTFLKIPHTPQSLKVFRKLGHAKHMKATVFSLH